MDSQRYWAALHYLECAACEHLEVQQQCEVWFKSPLALSPIHWSIINYRRRRFFRHSRHSMCWFKHKPVHISFTTKLVFWGVIKDLQFALGYCALAGSLPATLAVGAALHISSLPLPSHPLPFFFSRSIVLISLPALTPPSLSLSPPSSFLASQELFIHSGHDCCCGWPSSVATLQQTPCNVIYNFFVYHDCIGMEH